MKITKRQLRQIIKEEKAKVLAEQKVRRIVRRRLLEMGGLSHLNKNDVLGWGANYGIEHEVDKDGIITYRLDMKNPDHSALIELDPASPGGHGQGDSVPEGWEVIDQKGNEVVLSTTVSA